MNVVAYCRVSTDKEDQLNSLKVQKAFFEEYCERNNLNLLHVYADEGISGTKIKKRKDFMRLMKHSESGQFQMVLVKDVSRFARNAVDFLQSIRELKSRGIPCKFITSNLSTEDGELVLGMLALVAQEESKNTSSRIKFSKKINKEKGKVPNLVFGYDKIKGDYFNLNINSREAKTVQQIFHWYTEEGYGAGQIANMLNAKGIRTKRNCEWNQTAVCRLLQNRIYIGEIINGKEEVADFLTSRREKKDESEWYISVRPDLQLISRDQFEKVQTILKERHNAFHIKRERQSNKYLFSTLIKCKECGWSFRRMVRTYQKTYVRWVCSGHNGRGAQNCPNAVTVDEEELIKTLEDYFSKLIKQKENVTNDLIRDFTKKYSAGLQGDSQREELEEELERIKKVRQKYMDMYTDDLISREELKKKTGGMRAEIEKLKGKLSALDLTLGNEASIQETIEKSFQEIESITSVREMTNAQLKKIIEKIEVDKEGNVDIYLRFISDLGLTQNRSI